MKVIYVEVSVALVNSPWSLIHAQQHQQEPHRLLTVPSFRTSTLPTSVPGEDQNTFVNSVASSAYGSLPDSG